MLQQPKVIKCMRFLLSTHGWGESRNREKFPGYLPTHLLPLSYFTTSRHIKRIVYKKTSIASEACDRLRWPISTWLGLRVKQNKSDGFLFIIIIIWHKKATPTSFDLGISLYAIFFVNHDTKFGIFSRAQLYIVNIANQTLFFHLWQNLDNNAKWKSVMKFFCWGCS